MRPPLVALSILVLSLTVSSALATEPTAEELAQSRQFVAAHFETAPSADYREAGLRVVANHDPVTRNQRQGKPLRIGEREFTRGLFCHAVSQVEVQLPAPAKTFQAIVGVDSNDQTRPGRGSIVFSVEVAGQERFRSETLREGMAGVPIAVELNGAQQLTLKVSDAGDGIACDQADWAEAEVVLQDGKRLGLGDLPMLDGVANLTTPGAPFSFVYDGKPSAEFLAKWQFRHEVRKLDKQRSQHTVTYTDPATGLVIRGEAVEYHDFPVVEWTLYLKNTGTNDTPILENVLPLDLGCHRGDTGEFLLHHAVGSPCTQADFRPLETTLTPGMTKRLGGAGGRATSADLSYFNLEWPGEGLIVVAGWPGQWAAELVRSQGTGLQIRMGQEQTHFKLLPGEEVRTPMAVVQFWKGGDWLRAQNLWRRWMWAHGLVQPGGQPPKPALRASSSGAYEEMIKANEENQLMHIDRYAEERLGLNTWWMDAGWYPQQHGWPQVGTWETDPARFPNGFKKISQHAHAKGMQILVWFEPERVAADTWLTQNHPEWILGGAQGGVLNLGNPEAWKWLVNRVDTLLTEQGIDIYRQDFNMDPLALWRAADAPDRQGITEIRHITGLLAYWDELRRRHPDMLQDTCASGGRRVDIETLRRAVPLWRSDYAYEPIGQQAMTYGLSFWVPYHGTATAAYSGAAYYNRGATPVQPYAFWSSSPPSTALGIDIRVKEIDYDAIRKLVSQWRRVIPYYYGDFYPLTPYSLDAAEWIAWQFDQPETGCGLIQAFRRGKSPYLTAHFALRGLDPAATYEVTDLGAGTAPQRLSGKQLLEEGLPVTIATRPEAAVIEYRRAP